MAVLEGVFHKFGDDFVEHGTSSLQTRISIDLNQPHVVTRVDHEIHAEYFEVVDPAFGVDVECRGVYYVGSDLPHARIYHFPKIKGRILLLYVLIQLLVVNFVALFVFAVIGQILLHGVVGEMDAAVADFESVLG